MDTRIENTWTLGPTENGYWQVLWPRDMWSPITESTSAKKLWDLVFDMNKDSLEDVGFYLETDTGSMTHYISPYIYDDRLAEMMIERWISKNAEIWGVCYKSRESAEKFHNELNKRFTWYLLKTQD
jgi:hypothetical protein